MIDLESFILGKLRLISRIGLALSIEGIAGTGLVIGSGPRRAPISNPLREPVLV